MAGKSARTFMHVGLMACMLLAFRLVYSRQPSFGRELLTLSSGEPSLGAIAFLASFPIMLAAAAFLVTRAFAGEAHSSRRMAYTAVAVPLIALSILAPFAPFTVLAPWSLPISVLGSFAAIAGGALLARARA